MYKIFVNEYPIIITNVYRKEKKDKIYLLQTAPLQHIVSKLEKKDFKKVYLYHHRTEEMIPLLAKQFPLVVAAGGVVKNDCNETLLIYRNSKWDLPKGKIDAGETAEIAALREVKEETGIKELELGSLLKITYHIFKQKGSYKIKQTHWYHMKSNYKGILMPQLEEKITEAIWKKPDEIRQAMHNSYENIRLVLES